MAFVILIIGFKSGKARIIIYKKTHKTMKTRYLLNCFLFASLFLMAFECGDESLTEPVVEQKCIDESKIQRNAACIQIYDPVCGCDGKTYENSCLAGINGVTSFTKGECRN